MSDVLDRRHRLTQAAATAGVVLALAVGGTWGLSASAQDDTTSTTEPPVEEPEATTPESGTGSAEAYRECLAENGVTLPEKPADGERPDPSTMPDRETMRAAREACEDLLPPPPTEEELEAYRECLAENGVTLPEKPADGERPDPSTRPERPDPEVMEQAREACADLAPEGGVGMGGPGGHGPGGHGPRGMGGDCEDGTGDAPAAPSEEEPSEEEPSVEGSSLSL